MKCSACGNPHGSCSCDTPERRADLARANLATAKRAVIDAAVAWRTVPREKSLNDLLDELRDAADALLAVRGKP